MGEYDDFLNSVKEVALEAGALVRSHLTGHHDVHSKSKFDFVSEMDNMSEAFISSFIKQRYPDHLIFGEEAVSASEESEDSIINRLPDDKYIWVVDPVDGTTNFLHGIPQYAISIALVKNKEVLVGVVYDIPMDEIYYTAKGLPSYRNDKEIHVSDTESLDQSIIATSFPAADLEARNLVLKTLYERGQSLMSLRIWNCAAIGAVSLACGRVDAYVELGIHLWDFCAGKLIIENAGGKFTDVDGRPFHMLQKHVLATNGKLYDDVFSSIK